MSFLLTLKSLTFASRINHRHLVFKSLNLSRQVRVQRGRRRRPPPVGRGALSQVHLHRLPQRKHPRRDQKLSEARRRLQEGQVFHSTLL